MVKWLLKNPPRGIELRQSHFTTVLNEMLNLLPRHQFETLVRKYDSDRYVKRFNYRHQLVTMLYVQSSGKQSLCDIQKGLFYKLLDRCQDITPKHRFRFKKPLYSIDATTIDLCLSVFPLGKVQARRRRHQASL